MTLRVDGLEAGYGSVKVLRGITIVLAPGEVHALIGRNGAGKTTTLKAILGLVKSTAGRIDVDGTALTGLAAHEIPRLGLGYVPQGRRLFAELTVAENIDIGLFARRRGEATRERLLGLFPLLRDRLRQRAGTLSGGEQQMLAIARALALEPTILLLDEPTEGLMPSMIASIIGTIAALKAGGVGVLLVEQRVDTVLALADRVTFIDNGTTRESVAVAVLKADPALLHKYVGVGIGRSPLAPSVTARGQ